MAYRTTNRDCYIYGQFHVKKNKNFINLNTEFVKALGLRILKDTDFFVTATQKFYFNMWAAIFVTSLLVTLH